MMTLIVQIVFIYLEQEINSNRIKIYVKIMIFCCINIPKKYI